MVAKLGRSIQDYQGHLWKLVHDGDAERRMSTQGYQWKILEEILPQRMARCMKTEMADT